MVHTVNTCFILWVYVNMYLQHFIPLSCNKKIKRMKGHLWQRRNHIIRQNNKKIKPNKKKTKVPTYVPINDSLSCVDKLKCILLERIINKVMYLINISERLRVTLNFFKRVIFIVPCTSYVMIWWKTKNIVRIFNTKLNVTKLKYFVGCVVVPNVFELGYTEWIL